MVRIKGVAPAAHLTALQVAMRMRIDFELVDGIRAATRAQLSLPSPAAASSHLAPQPPRCIIPGCNQLATHFCATMCKEQCAKHERDGHAWSGKFAGHTRGLLADKAALVAAKERQDLEEMCADAADEWRKSLEPHATKIREKQEQVQALKDQTLEKRTSQH